MAAAAVEGNYRIAVDSGGEYETPYSLMVVAECIDDVLEPNGAMMVAREVLPGVHADLQICDGDEDWYIKMKKEKKKDNEPGA